MVQEVANNVKVKLSATCQRLPVLLKSPSRHVVLATVLFFDEMIAGIFYVVPMLGWKVYADTRG